MNEGRLICEGTPDQVPVRPARPGVLLGQGGRAVLEIRRMDVAYGHARVLHDVELRLSPGEMVFIVGRNGAGKTTLLKTIAGLLKPTQGEIRFDGRPVARPEARSARSQRLPLCRPGQAGLQHLVGALEHRARRARRRRARRGGLAQSRSRSTRSSMSSGRCQPAGSPAVREILLIGRALVGNPRLLLIDEPTEGLAAVVIEDIFRILQRMRQTVASIIVEQNLSIVGAPGGPDLRHEGRPDRPGDRRLERDRGFRPAGVLPVNAATCHRPSSVRPASPGGWRASWGSSPPD
ncbi:MAG: ATP-binding cassette domain-containing protein [Chromatiales bacterium]|nr:ATP-binding cassette domain-containing protein [Chromatiales bacterium]